MELYRRDGTAYPSGVDDVLEWAKDFQDPAKQIVAQEHLPNGYFVSTVWLGLNHQWGDGPPLIFETMIFGADGATDYQERYATEADAIQGHQRAVEFAKGLNGH